MQNFAHVLFGMDITNNSIMPYFVRAGLIYRAKTGGALNSTEQMIVDMPFAAFQRMVYELRDTYDFWDQLMDDGALDRFETLEEILFIPSFRGAFTPCVDLVPEFLLPDDGSEVKPAGFEEELYDPSFALFIPLDRQPTPLGGGYSCPQAVFEEMLRKVTDLGVELPADFPWWNVIGTLYGVDWPTPGFEEELRTGGTDEPSEEEYGDPW